MRDVPAISESGLAAEALRILSCGVALAEIESLALRFENATFFRWFPASGDAVETLASRMSRFKPEQARAALAVGRAYEFEQEVRDGPQILSLRIHVARKPLGAEELLLVQAVDASKEKEAEYMLESYSRMAEKNARELQREKERAEKLLLNIMPRIVYEELKNYGTTTPQRFDQASVLMLDFIGFTDMAISRDPGALVAELNDIFSAFDRIVELFGCERIKTIGDAYVAVSGLPEENPDHAVNIAKVALRMRRYLDKRNASHPTQWKCRIGIASGPVIGSMVGIQKYVYDIFGPAVNLAARLEQLSGPMQITLTEEAYRKLSDAFVARDRGTFDIKGFGERRLYALDYEVEHRG